MSTGEAVLLRFLNLPFLIVVPPLLAILAAMLWGMLQSSGPYIQR